MRARAIDTGRNRSTDIGPYRHRMLDPPGGSADAGRRRRRVADGNGERPAEEGLPVLSAPTGLDAASAGPTPRSKRRRQGAQMAQVGVERIPSRWGCRKATSVPHGALRGFQLYGLGPDPLALLRMGSASTRLLFSQSPGMVVSPSSVSLLVSRKRPVCMPQYSRR